MVNVLFEIFLNEVLDHFPADSIDEDECTLTWRNLTRVCENSPCRTTQDTSPHLLRRGMPNRETNSLLRRNKRRPFVNCH
jgi:hypothetical protein